MKDDVQRVIQAIETLEGRAATEDELWLLGEAKSRLILIWENYDRQQRWIEDVYDAEVSGDFDRAEELRSRHPFEND